MNSIKAAQVIENTIGAVSVQNVIKSVSGTVHLGKGRLWLHQIDTGLLRMQELHLRAIRRTHGSLLSASYNPTPQRAASVYYRALICSLAQYLVLSDKDRVEMFRGLFNFISRHRSIAGLESLFLTGLVTSGRTQHNHLFQDGIKLWKSLGAPKTMGGGNRVTPFLDTKSKTIAFLDAKAVGKVDIHLDAPNATQSLGQQITSMGAECADGKEICQGIFTVAGAVIGWVATKNPSGGSAGAGIGLGTGKIVCDLIFDGQSAAPVGYSGQGGADAGVGGQDAGQQIGRGESSGESSSSSSGEENQSIDPSQSSNTSSDNQSDSENSSSDSSDDSSGNDDGDAGRPNPDDSGGMPDPDAPGAMPVSSQSFLVGSGLSAYVTNVGRSGVGFMLNSVPQLATGANSVEHLGMLAGFHDFAATLSTQSDNGAGLAIGIDGVTYTSVDVNAKEKIPSVANISAVRHE